MSFISKNMGQFRYFDALLGHPTWKGKTMLDFGGNGGNILLDPNTTIDHDKYWCIDVSKDAIELGRQRFPEAHFVFYDCYNFEFNPGGVKDLPLPELGIEFDYILAVSVLGTNMPRAEMLRSAARLRGWLGNDGVLAFTFIDPHSIAAGSKLTNLQHFIDTGYDGLDASQRQAAWYTIKDEDVYVESEPTRHYPDSEDIGFLALYTPRYMQSLFPDAEILEPVPPLSKHHCCVIKGKRTPSFISNITGHFAYFDTVLKKPEWRGKTVLDVGGNMGNILSDTGCSIEEDKYWCLEVSRDAVDLGRKLYPKAHFAFYDRYNFEFNPTGTKALPLPALGCRFDFIISSAVFGTNTRRTEMIDIVNQLRGWLTADGLLAFTFLDPSHAPPDTGITNLRHYLDGGLRALDDSVENGAWYTIKNEDLYLESDAVKVYEDGEGNGFLTLYTPGYMRSLFPDAEILPPAHPFLKSHCCVLRRK